LPYGSVPEFFKEYLAFCHAEHLTPSGYAKDETFRKTFLSLKNEFRLIGAKGSMPTCDICNNANDMLRASHIKDQSSREIILKFKRLHLQQQMKERQYMEQNRIVSKTLVNGQPTQFFCLIDAMTCSRGDVPQTGRKFRQGKSEISHQIENRVIGEYIHMKIISASSLCYSNYNITYLSNYYVSLSQRAKSSVEILTRSFYITQTI
jgi:hypothetical protein